MSCKRHKTTDENTNKTMDTTDESVTRRARIGKRILTGKTLGKKQWIRRWIARFLIRDTLFPFSSIKDHAGTFFVDYFDTRASILFKWKRRSEFIGSLGEFRARLGESGNGVLDDVLEMPRVFLGGGAVVTLLRAGDSWRTYPFDFDIFLLASPYIVEDLGRLLLHFDTYARARGCVPHFIIRGMLIEVLIGGARRIQIIVTRFKDPWTCMYLVDLAYDQIFYDGEHVWMSHLAFSAFNTGFTRSTRVPVKSTRLSKLRAKGFTILGSYQQTELDPTYTALLDKIDDAKAFLDKDPRRVWTCVGLDVHLDFVSAFEAVLVQIDYRWHSMRFFHLHKHFLFSDIDIFDQNFRVFSFVRDPIALHNLTYLEMENGSRVLGECLGGLGFSTISFVHCDLSVLQVRPDRVVCKRDEVLHRFLKSIERLYILHPTAIGDPVPFSLTIFGSRVYDSAERPMEEWTGASRCTISFIVLVSEDTWTLECIDLYVQENHVTC